MKMPAKDKKISGHCRRGFTVIELLIAVVLLVAILGSILGAFEIIHRFYKDGIALANSQGTARLVVENIGRSLRQGQSVSVSPGGGTIAVTKYDGSVDTFNFTADTMQKNGNTIGVNIYQISGNPIFAELVTDHLVAISFAVRHEGMFGYDKEVRILTKINLRN